ncbi:hypothetical protein Tco_0404073 [Tanacetum coccineum]
MMEIILASSSRRQTWRFLSDILNLHEGFVYTIAENGRSWRLFRINITLKKEDLDDLFGSLYEEYYKTRNPKVSTDFAAPNTLNNEDTPSSSTIVVDDNEAPQIVSTSEEPTSPIPNDFADE